MGFLRDQVAVFETGMERLEAEHAEYDAMASHGFTFSYDLCRATQEAVESGVLINPETMNAIKRVERNYVTPYGGESLTHQYEHLRELKYQGLSMACFLFVLCEFSEDSSRF